MSDSTLPAVQNPDEAGLSQLQRLIYAFTAPGKLFADFKRSTTWWMPFLVLVVMSYVLAFAIQTKVGWSQVTENIVQSSPRTAAQFEKLPPEQAATQKKFITLSTQFSMYLSPVVILLSMVIIAAVLLFTINFAFGGKARFGAVLAVLVYASLPTIIQSLTGTLALLAGLGETFNISNFSGTNVAYYLNAAETAPALYKLAQAIDPISIWSMALTSIGLATVAGLKRNSGYIAVFGWWALILVIKVGWAAAFGS
jgi:hypothetical protein